MLEHPRIGRRPDPARAPSVTRETPLSTSRRCSCPGGRRSNPTPADSPAQGDRAGREKVADCRENGVRPLADQEVAAVRDHAQRRAEPPGVLHPVRERHPVVRARPRGRGRGSRPARGRAAGRSGRAPSRRSGCRCGRAAPARNASAIAGSKPGRVGDAPPAERERPPPAASAPHGGAAARRGARAAAARARRPSARRRACRTRSPPPRRARARVTASGRCTAARSPTSPPSECPTHGAGSASSCSRTASTASAKRSRDGARGRAARAAVAGKLRDDHAPPAARAAGAIEPPVRRGAAEAVDEHERRPLAADEVAERRCRRARARAPRSRRARARPLARADRGRLDSVITGAYSLRDECFGGTGRLMLVGSTIEGVDKPV